MRSLIAILTFVLISSAAMADRYFFKVDLSDNEMVGSWKQGTGAPDKLANSRRYFVEVTQAQYGGGTGDDYAAVPNAVKVAARDAMQADLADIDKELPKISRAFAKVLLGYINEARVAAGLAAKTPAEFKADVRATVNP